MRTLALPERQLVNAGLGLRLLLPEGWLLLKPEQTLVPVPAQTIAALAHPRLGGCAFVAAKAAPRGVLTAP